MNALAPFVRQLPALLQGPECEIVFSQMEAYLGTVYRPKLILDLWCFRKVNRRRNRWTTAIHSSSREI
jgi:hypothetical protein